MTGETIRLKLSGPQKAILTDTHRFKVVCAGRRFGKSYLAAVRLLIGAWNNPKTVRWYIAPTYRMAKEVEWKELKRLVPHQYIDGLPNETDLTIRLLSGSTISLRGADNPNALRGVGLDDVVFDEAADIDENAWHEVIRPTLADRGGSAIFMGTPRGYNWFYRLYNLGEAVNDDGTPKNPDWRSFRFTSDEGGIIPKDELSSLKASMDPRLFRQEHEASFETMAGRVYINFDRAGNVQPVEDNGGALLIGMDFNVAPMSAVVAVKAGDELHVLHEIEITDSNTDEMAQEIKRRYPGRRIVVYPDPSGNSRRTAAPVGQTDFSILRRAGFEVLAPSSAPPVVDRINEVNGLCCNAQGRRRLLIHPRCQRTIECLSGLIYKKDTSVVDKTMGLDHLPDALGYLVHVEFPLIASRAGMVKLSGY